MLKPSFCSYRTADVAVIRLLRFQSQEAKHVWNSSELLDQEAWGATLVLVHKQTTDKFALSNSHKKKVAAILEP